MIDISWAEKFAGEWVDAWNSHNPERILLHYEDDFEITSPLIVTRMGIKSGSLKGKRVVGRSVTAKRIVVERLEFNERLMVVRDEALVDLKSNLRQANIL